MPIKYVSGDIFEAPSQTIVNTVNTKGIMGKGLALSFRRRYAKMFKDYRERCARGEVRVGEPYLYTATRPWILNFPTKDHWRNPSKLSWIRAGLEYFAEHYRDWGITSIAFPQLGTLNGKLAWPEVRTIMEELLDPLDIDVAVYSIDEEDARQTQPIVTSTSKQPRLL